MFDRIAYRYDLLNRLLSFRRDIAWRKCLCAHLPERGNQRILDLATGTGDVLLSVYRGSSKVVGGVGLDMSANMLRFSRKKVESAGLARDLTMMRSDACAIGSADASFDAATMSFGIRNVPDVPRALREIRRILRPGGRALILEFSLPSNRVFRALYLLYFRHVLPFVGGLVSGNREAYRYLNSSVESFPYGEAFLELLREVGFSNVKALPLTMGIATLYLGDK
jgi:demethylmenaquinone methyltransferase/2-methoxy-6-polyprenyl-1,4-benzoquinol methylase